MIKYRNATNGGASVTTSTTLVLAANESRKRAIIVNSGAGAVWLSFGAAAVVGQGVYLGAVGGSYEISPDELYVGVINGISASGTNIIGVTEFY